MMNKKRTGLRMAFIYALSVTISGILFLNCDNSPELEKPVEASALNETGSKALQNKSGKDKPTDQKIQDNLRIVLRTVIEEDHEAHHERNYEHDNKNHSDSHKNHDSHELDIDRIYLSFGRIEVLSPSKGWTVLQAEPGQARTLEISPEPGVEVEITQAAVDTGEYTKVKVYLTDDNYVVLSTDPGTFHTLYFEHDGENDHKYKENRHGDEHENDSDTSDDKGHRLKIEHFKPVVVQDGYLTTIYLEVEVDELVEYEDKKDKYEIDIETYYTESILSPLITEKAGIKLTAKK